MDFVVGRSGKAMKAERAGRGAVIGGLSFSVPIVILYCLYRGGKIVLIKSFFLSLVWSSCFYWSLFMV